ncbi:Uncharacterised protein [Moraxella caprae]|uniref:Uncharacterized protein n=1 Tax=Moraxella caprae TaxID=90240 RepID=A0A378QXG8_9GAMM|nr:Uncharacterised protein [Moraxella caprae]
MSLPKISFEVMVKFPEVLEEEINEHNHYYKTNFHITKIYDNNDYSFCTIEATQYQLRDIFDLGYGFYLTQNQKAN